MTWGGDLVDGPVHDPTRNHLDVVVTGPVVIADACSTTAAGGDAVAVLHHLASWHRPDAHLLVVGEVGGDSGRTAVAELVRELGLPRCWLLGPVDDTVRTACWRRADAALALDLEAPLGAIVATAGAAGIPVVGRDPRCDVDIADDSGVVAAEALALLLSRSGT